MVTAVRSRTQNQRLYLRLKNVFAIFVHTTTASWYPRLKMGIFRNITLKRLKREKHYLFAVVGLLLQEIQRTRTTTGQNNFRRGLFALF